MEKCKLKTLGVLLVTALVLFMIGFVSSATDPTGPDDIDVIANETKTASSGKIVNISGGRVATLDLNATVQNPHWKAFVGNVTGKFTLDDTSGSTIYDWSLTVTTGRVYGTRNSSTPDWTGINCSGVADLEQENDALNHTSSSDNITATFNASSPSFDHDAFYVGSETIDADSCPTLSTYINNDSQTQGSDKFEEMALYDGVNVIYVTLLEEDEEGFDGNTYDFQMIVPEIATDGYSGSTAYYLYVELD